jgi:hypothetical protein
MAPKKQPPTKRLLTQLLRLLTLPLLLLLTLRLTLLLPTLRLLLNNPALHNAKSRPPGGFFYAH